MGFQTVIRWSVSTTAHRSTSKKPMNYCKQAIPSTPKCCQTLKRPNSPKSPSPRCRKMTQESWSSTAAQKTTSSASITILCVLQTLTTLKMFHSAIFANPAKSTTAPNASTAIASCARTDFGLGVLPSAKLVSVKFMDAVHARKMEKIAILAIPKTLNYFLPIMSANATRATSTICQEKSVLLASPKSLFATFAHSKKKTPSIATSAKILSTECFQGTAKTASATQTSSTKTPQNNASFAIHTKNVSTALTQGSANNVTAKASGHSTLNPSASARPIMLKLITSALYVHHLSQPVPHARLQISAILAMFHFSETSLQQPKASVPAKMDTLKMIKTFVYCVLYQDVPTAKYKMYAVFAILRFIESKRLLMVNAYATRLTLKTLSVNASCVQPQAASTARAKTHALSAM